MISSNGRGSWSEYLSVTYNCSPDRESSFEPSQTSDVDKNVSVFRSQYGCLLHDTFIMEHTVSRDTEMLSHQVSVQVRSWRKR